VLVEALVDKNPHVRMAAAHALGKIADVQVLPELRRVANHDTAITNQKGYFGVATAAREAIATIEGRIDQLS
jgi:HEAT repeat protein